MVQGHKDLVLCARVHIRHTFPCPYLLQIRTRMLASWSFLTLIWLLEILPLATAHIIHVAASKKDCFFEDLNINDKVSYGVVPVRGVMNELFPVDDCHISSWRWRATRHRFLGEYYTVI
jgi:hypothetical protein